MHGISQRLRRYLMTGLIVIAPIGVTAWILSWLFVRLDPIIGRHLPTIFGYEPRGLGLLALLGLLVLVGWVSQKAMGRRALRAWNAFANRLPVGSGSHIEGAIIDDVIGEPAVAVFVPTVPNPTSGFLLFVPRSRVNRLDMTVEEGFKMILSVGLAVPDPAAAEPPLNVR